MGTPVEQCRDQEITTRASGASAQTVVLAAPPPGLSTVVDAIALSNTAGGTATFATVSIQNHADSSVLWEVDVESGPLAAPSLFAILSAPGGLYKGNKDIRFDVVVTMTGATALKVNVKSHSESPN